MSYNTDELGKMKFVVLTFEQTLKGTERIENITCGIPSTQGVAKNIPK
jgi:hypothetical protein